MFSSAELYLRFQCGSHSFTSDLVAVAAPPGSPADLVFSFDSGMVLLHLPAAMLARLSFQIELLARRKLRADLLMASAALPLHTVATGPSEHTIHFLELGGPDGPAELQMGLQMRAEGTAELTMLSLKAGALCHAQP